MRSDAELPALSLLSFRGLWAARGHSAAAIAPEDKGIGLLLAEGGEPTRIKSAFLSDEQVYALADTAAWLRASRHLADDTLTTTRGGRP